MSQEETKTIEQHASDDDLARPVQIRTMAQKTKEDIQTMQSLVEAEKQRRAASLEREKRDLEKELAIINQKDPDAVSVELQREVEDINAKLREFPDRYLAEVCTPLGHSPKTNYVYGNIFPNTECKLCGRTVNIAVRDVMQDIERWIKLS